MVSAQYDCVLKFTIYKYHDEHKTEVSMWDKLSLIMVYFEISKNIIFKKWNFRWQYMIIEDYFKLEDGCVMNHEEDGWILAPHLEITYKLKNSGNTHQSS
jgi:hypothetical protein